MGFNSGFKGLKQVMKSYVTSDDCRNTVCDGQLVITLGLQNE